MKTQSTCSCLLFDTIVSGRGGRRPGQTKPLDYAMENQAIETRGPSNACWPGQVLVREVVTGGRWTAPKKETGLKAPSGRSAGVRELSQVSRGERRFRLCARR